MSGTLCFRIQGCHHSQDWDDWQYIFYSLLWGIFSPCQTRLGQCLIHLAFLREVCRNPHSPLETRNVLSHWDVHGKSQKCCTLTSHVLPRLCESLPLRCEYLQWFRDSLHWVLPVTEIFRHCDFSQLYCLPTCPLCCNFQALLMRESFLRISITHARYFLLWRRRRWGDMDYFCSLSSVDCWTRGGCGN
jgi:hypothetical protein